MHTSEPNEKSELIQKRKWYRALLWDVGIPMIYTTFFISIAALGFGISAFSMALVVFLKAG